MIVNIYNIPSKRTYRYGVEVLFRNIYRPAERSLLVEHIYNYSTFLQSTDERYHRELNYLLNKNRSGIISIEFDKDRSLKLHDNSTNYNIDDLPWYLRLGFARPQDGGE